MNHLNLLNLQSLRESTPPPESAGSPPVLVILADTEAGTHLAPRISLALQRCGIAVLPSTVERVGAALESCVLPTIRRVMVDGDVHLDGNAIVGFQRSFLCGHSELLSRLGSTTARDPVLGVFLDCCARIPSGIAVAPSPKLLARLREREDSQARIVRHSVDALVGASPGSGSFDKWLGNTTRDAIGHCILEQANQFFVSTKTFAVDWPWHLCDRLFDAVDAFVQRFGFAEHRGMGGEIGSTLAEVFAECLV